MLIYLINLGWLSVDINRQVERSLFTGGIILPLLFLLQGPGELRSSPSPTLTNSFALHSNAFNLRAVRKWSEQTDLPHANPQVLLYPS